MDKWTVSGQVAVIILDSIKRNITKVYRGSVSSFMLHAGSCCFLVLSGGVGVDEPLGLSVVTCTPAETLSRALLIKAELLPLAEKQF